MLDRITLTAGEVRAELRPDAGGRIGQIEVAGRRLLRGEHDSDGGWLAWGSYPLVPWSNRIAAGRFVFEGATYQMPVNFDDGTALHGLGAQAPWEVTAHDAVAAVLELSIDHSPFLLSARQEFQLTPDRLVQTLQVTNRASRRVPVGLGIHPWFPAGPIAVPASAHWPLVDALPVGPIEAFSPRPGVPELAVPGVLDHCLTGLTGRRANVPGLTLEWSDEIAHVVVYTAVPGWQCVEPVTNANDGFNLAAAGAAGHGVVTLGPGESSSATFGFVWEPAHAV
ncbi:MAG TPA: hypothetical protein VNQ73_15960 [Ilumatobacter sp.]|nr:hypothetical protein [Ilumatobacter sp.]